MSTLKTTRYLSADEMDDLFDEPESSQSKQEQRVVLSEEQRENIEQIKKDNKYHLPVMYLNDGDWLESKPRSERVHFTDEIAVETCLNNCNGHAGVGNACCILDPDDLEHVLGPVSEKWISKMIRWYKKKGIYAERSDIVIDFEEGQVIGRAHFNNHKVFQDPKTYPILRIQAYGPRYACKFLNVHNGKCGIYSVRSAMCRNYYCQYVFKNYLLRDPNHPSKWIERDKNDNRAK